MANSAGAVFRLKCSSRRGPRFSLWTWCILFECFISLPCIFSKCLGFDLTVSSYPEGDITILHGRPLEIFCTAENYTSDDIDFMFAGHVLKYPVVQKVNSTTKRLFIEKPDKQLSTYYCKNNKTGKNCVNRVTIDSPPANVTDFKCISRNVETLNCSWTSPENVTTTNYTLTFVDSSGMDVRPCSAETVEGMLTRYCKWNTTSKPRYRQQEESFDFRLKACNIFGCNLQQFIIDHYSIVKPDPPMDLQILHTGPHSVEFQWKIPNNIFNFVTCGIDTTIEYQIDKIDNKAQFHKVNASNLPSNEKIYKFQLNDLPYANMHYEVRIYIRPKKAVDNEFWSHYVFKPFYTSSERPRRPPDMISGAFDQFIYEKMRLVYIYWKQLEEYEQAGANFTYKVVVYQGSSSKTYFADRNKSLSYVMLEEASLEAMDVSVWSRNVIGSSVNSSQMHIPSEKDTHNLAPSSFTKLAHENGTYELSWVGIQNIDNYTVFWCRHNTTNYCVGQMNFSVVASNQNRHFINLPREHRYQFAIAANKGMRTSGMIWAICDISKVGFELVGIPVTLNHGAPGKTHVNIFWKMDCALRDGIITGYFITYCPVIQTSSLCDERVGNRTVNVTDAKQMQLNVTDLLPFKTYQFTIALNTKHGKRYVGNISTEVTTTEDVPTPPRNIVVSDITSDSIVISWDPPLNPNGNIGKYVIYNYTQEVYVDVIVGLANVTARRSVMISRLTGFTNYTWSVKACNIAINVCSDIAPSIEGVFMRTRIGRPSRLKAPRVLNNPDLIEWDAPDVPGGTVDLYQIRRQKDDMAPEIFNATNLSYKLLHCDGVAVSETYQVRAVNFDEHSHHGALAVSGAVSLPRRDSDHAIENEGEWSEPSTVTCRGKDVLSMIYIFLSIFIIIVGLAYGSLKLVKKLRKMDDIEPKFPDGLIIPEKDVSNKVFWNPSDMDDKPSSDEMLLLPNSKAAVFPELKQDSENCGVSDHTDSTGLSDSSQGTADRQASTSDDGSNSSLHMKVDAGASNDSVSQDDSSGSDTEGPSPPASPAPGKLPKKASSGYVQHAPPAVGYVQAAPPGSSYVLAALSPPIFTTGVSPPPAAGYVRAEDVSRSMMNFPKLGPSPTKAFGPDSLHSLPTMPLPKHSESSYVPLEALGTAKGRAGYAEAGDAVLAKHMNKLAGAGEDGAVLDPAMSADAYCRFSWSTDPAQDNLNLVLARPHTLHSEH